MGSFWERVVQPQVFTMMLFRFPDARGPLPSRRWRDAIANGQYILLRREAYLAIGGHQAVRDEVVEDLRIAQILVKGGRRLSFRLAEDDFATRMYRGLGELVRGWSKNILIGGRLTLPRRLRPLVAPLSLAAGAGLWLAPPLALLASLLGVGEGALLLWSAAAVITSALFWGAASLRMGISPLYGALYPLGAAVGTWILLRSWRRGSRVEWKGREYEVRLHDGLDTPPPPRALG